MNFYTTHANCLRLLISRCYNEIYTKQMYFHIILLDLRPIIHGKFNSIPLKIFLIYPKSFFNYTAIKTSSETM